MKIALISCFETYNIRTDQVEAYFIDKNVQVDRIQSNFAHRNKAKIDTSNKKIKYISVPKYVKNFSITRLFSHFVFSIKVFWHLKKNDYDFVYCLIPPNSLVFFISFLSNKFKIYYDVIDLWPEAMPLGRFKNFKLLKLWSGLRDRKLNRASHIITECNYFKEHIRNQTEITNLSTIYFYGGEAISTNNIFKENLNIKFVYVGSINNLIDIDLLILFLKEFSNNLIFNIIGEGEKKDFLIENLKEIGVKVNDYGVVFDDQVKADIIKDSDFGINLMKDSTKVGLTMKSIEYFRFGIPIINNIPSDTWNFVEENEVGFNIHTQNIKSISQALYLLNPEEYFEMKENVKYLYQKNFSKDEFVNKMNNIFVSKKGD